MNRKWYIYYFITLSVFAIGRWWIVQHYQLASSTPLANGQQTLLIWVSVFFLLLFGPAFYFSVRKLNRMIAARIKRFRIFTYVYSLFFSLLIFGVVYFMFLLLFYRSVY
ncbi:hypothetical protein [Thermoflavimicrobium dichotomicum]|uniref:Uncharacterized protein n=1 Tax=Thermoflavimicrobium dichotomicum TaxID=46223 RepID=A0A1I3LV75_9BACL|nr:hypothetical protein [Thermoflavimicrobium dichotomicum]SFI88661.1 hypothetical protein SAMN05421852_102335 [Thermoflavimicrobium dichotomicum]